LYTLFKTENPGNHKSSRETSSLYQIRECQAEEDWEEKKMWPKEVGEIQDGGQCTNDKNKKNKGRYVFSWGGGWGILVFFPKKVLALPCVLTEKLLTPHL